MKKQYIQPSLKLHRLRMEQQILAVSPNVKVKDFTSKDEEYLNPSTDYDISPELKPGDGSDFN